MTNEEELLLHNRYPEGVRCPEEGWADCSSYAAAEVTPGELTGNGLMDEAVTTAPAGLPETPFDVTCHMSRLEDSWDPFLRDLEPAAVADEAAAPASSVVRPTGTSAAGGPARLRVRRPRQRHVQARARCLLGRRCGIPWDEAQAVGDRTDRGTRHSHKGRRERRERP